jgi:modulator of FtsH protease
MCELFLPAPAGIFTNIENTCLPVDAFVNVTGVEYRSSGVSSMNTEILSSGRLQGASVNAVLRNTYWLLSLTLAFAASTAGVSMALNLPHPGLLLTLAGYFGLLFLTSHYRNSALGLVLVFALTGFMGYTLGPILNAYIGMAGGAQIVMTAFAGTGIIFLGLSGYALTTRRDFSFLGGMLFVGILVAFLAGLAALFFDMPALSLAVSAMFVLLMSALILYETQQIARGGETNYIMATVALFVSIFNLFTSLLHLLGFASQE